MANSIIRGGGEFVSYYAKEPDLIKEFAGIYNFAINWKTKFTSHPYTIRRYLRFTYSYPDDNKFITDTLFKKLPEGHIRRLFWKKVKIPQK